MLATVKPFGTGKCLSIGTQTAGVDGEFADSTIRGFLGLKELLKLLMARTNNGNNAVADQPRVDQQPR